MLAHKASLAPSGQTQGPRPPRNLGPPLQHGALRPPGGSRSCWRLPAVGRTAYSYETGRLLKCLLTRQAIKTTLNYLSETNGELHFFLHNYWADQPLVMDGSTDADEWLVRLAATPWTKVQDPRRSSVVSAAAEAAVMNGEREVSPREVAERIMRLREHIAKEMAEDLARIPADNTDVLKRTLAKTFTEVKMPE
ncbi:hypothetical protein PLESTB_000474400 [Pleodorina starrii]|uniref:Uncharacterized protein n=1 Tax=Pleodorina starrii TaxID=330485 RepID=A0A9W6EZL2_9CHLO|nr:hypothetical protein PLESTM_001592300 [Pleodorina starrii]GLC51178.1 hypothetical protein PLESTB_000474400 [Pleodorina starrii]GLC63536.1 hypothetical protein PLESTF_000046900 [Pleodorina starrii]